MPLAAYRKASDLPAELAIFPLGGAMLFPRWTLPLNIFEPRYLNMIDDAMSGSRLIGMIQPKGDDPAHPSLSVTGCAGRITTYSETDDGRYLISLTGICRFGVSEELAGQTPYRRIRPDWTPYLDDLIKPRPNTDFDRAPLVASLKRYADNNTIEIDWDAVDHAPLETLVHALCTGCDFSPMEKQALLEADTVEQRAETLITLLDMDRPGDDTSTLQ